MDDIVVSKQGNYHIQATWAGEDLFLTILDGTCAWSCQIDQEAFQGIDGRTGNRVENSADLARNAFGGDGGDKFDLSIQDNKLIWKQVGGKAKIKLAEIPLTSISFLDAQSEVLGQLIAVNKELKSKNKEFKRRQENLVRDLKKSKNMLVEFEKEKTEIESNMYARFLPILNEKKEKILELERNRQGGVASHDISEDDYGSATDEDPDESVGAMDTMEQGETSSKRAKTMDDSLGLLDDSLT